MAPDIPVDAPFGPAPPPRDWRRVQAATGRAMGDSWQWAQPVLDAAFDAWAMQFEEEAMLLTGQEGKATFRLGLGPRLCSVPFLQQTAVLECKGVGAAAALANIAHQITELRNLAGKGLIVQTCGVCGPPIDPGYICDPSPH